MATNILILPQMEATFRIARNADWVDWIIFPTPPLDGGGPNPLGSVIDLSGIDFYAQVRPDMEDPNVLLDMNTINGLLVNGGPTGKLSWHVPHTTIQSILGFKVINSAVIDILAVADGYRVNLFQEAGPGRVEVYHGVTLLAG